MSNFNSYPAQPEILHTQMYTDVEFIGHRLRNSLHKTIDDIAEIGPKFGLFT